MTRCFRNLEKIVLKMRNVLNRCNWIRNIDIFSNYELICELFF